jgi:hypothetical protein
MTRGGNEGWGLITTHTFSLRGGNVSDRRSNPSCLGEGHRARRFAYWFKVDRDGLLPRADNKLCRRGK